MFAGPFLVLLILTVKGVLYMPIYTLFIGLAFGAAIVVPMGYIYAVSGFQVPVGYFNEIVYGYVSPAYFFCFCCADRKRCSDDRSWRFSSSCRIAFVPRHLWPVRAVCLRLEF